MIFCCDLSCDAFRTRNRRQKSLPTGTDQNADDQARFDVLVRTGSQLLSAFMRAFLLATSAGWRARLMLPTGVLSGVECPVTSKYIASAASGWNCDFDKRVSLAMVWKGASTSFHSILAFSIQKLASWRLPQYVIRSGSRSWTLKSKLLILLSSLRCRISSSCRPFGLLLRRECAALSRDGVAECFTTSVGPWRNGTVLQYRSCW